MKQAIARAIDYLKSVQHDGGHWVFERDERNPNDAPAAPRRFAPESDFDLFRETLLPAASRGYDG